MSDRTLFWGETTDGARYQSGDSDPEGGDFIVAKNTDNDTVLLQWNQTATEWEFAGAVDMGGNDLTNAGLLSGVNGSFDTLEAEQLLISDFPIRKVDQYVQDSNTDSTIDISFDVDAGKNYNIYTIIQPRNAGQFTVQFNNDTAVDNGNYAYWDESGTKTTNEDSIQIIEYSSFPRITGHISLGGIEDKSGRAGLSNNLNMGRPGQISTYCQKGGWEKSEELESIQITVEGGLTTGDRIEVWESF